MAKLNLEKLYTKQISLTEWFEDIKHNQTQALRLEDNDKRERLAQLNNLIGLPFDKSVQFPAIDLAEKTLKFRQYFAAHKNEFCALRLIPNNITQPKLRMRGITIKKAMEWFAEQKINPAEYKADFVPHGNRQKYSTIFVVNKYGIFGEIIKGGHYQLTQGFYDQGEPITFSFNFRDFVTADNKPATKKYLNNIVRKIQIRSKKKQSMLKKQLKAKFYNNYLTGYFETVDTREFGLWFIDYNRILGEMYRDYNLVTDKPVGAVKSLSGQVAAHGKVKGRVKIIKSESILNATIEENEILVSDMTTPDFLPLMQKSLGIITDLGGILSHAAIISREIKKPCITGVKIATQILKDGDMVEIDTSRSEIIIID